MLAKVISSTVVGIEAEEVVVEVDVSGGLPGFSIVGLPDTAVKESINRVKAAIKNCGFEFPGRKITVNLAPGDIKKHGPSFDLPIALGIMTATGQIHPDSFHGKVICGELSLDGKLRPIAGSLALALAFKNKRLSNLLLPQDNSAEAAIARGIEVLPLVDLRQAVGFLRKEVEILPQKVDLRRIWKDSGHCHLDMSDVKGQTYIKRALEIAACGRHNILMMGPAGSGKSMLAKRLPTIMPEMTLEEALEATKIHSVSGLLTNKAPIVTERPFRAPHHTISDVALVGGGSIPQPGEISMAHNGVLFLDELPEFHRDALEALRQPLEDGVIRIARVNKYIELPCNFMLVCAMNPCPCGRLGQKRHPCSCSTTQVYRYRSKISSPLLDRIDIHIDVKPLKYPDLKNNEPCESSKDIKMRVKRAHKTQKARFRREGILFNSAMSSRQIKKYCILDENAANLLRAAMEKYEISARGYDKILKVARTIADASQSGEIRAEHLSEAIQYRSLDRDVFV
ncbi:MAG: YifB family Mg chelatase-like AAA ATPase [Candidatus Omnitrophica bacterium]|nr:YifB family Mg chelatase-like AAA ATPase [Candidatus Omnitrophota bacterium]